MTLRRALLSSFVREEDTDATLDTPTKLKTASQTLLGDGSYAISVAAAGNTLLISLLFPKIGASAVAAGPLIAAAQNLVVGFCQTYLVSLSLILGNSLGKAKAQRAASMLGASIDIAHEIGVTIRTGYGIGLLLAITATLLLLPAASFFSLFIEDSAVTDDIFDYFCWYALGIVAMFHSFIDQQLEVVIGPKWFPACRGITYTVLSYTFSSWLIETETYPGMKGVGLGTALAAWAVLLLTKLHQFVYARPRQFALYDWSFLHFRATAANINRIGLRLGIQVFSEWVYFVGQSAIVASTGTVLLRAIQPLTQVLSLANLYCLGYAAAAAARVAEILGHLAHDRANARPIINSYVKRYGTIAIVCGAVLPIVLTITMLANPNIFSQHLLHGGATPEEREQSNTVLQIGSFFLLANVFRALNGSPLRGFKDIVYPLVLNAILMSAIGLPISGGLLLTHVISLPDMLLISASFVMLSALIVGRRWWQFSQATIAEKIWITETNNTHPRDAILFPLAKAKQQLAAAEPDTHPMAV